MAVDVLRPSELTPEQTAVWRAWQAADPDLGSPFLTPDWAQAVEAAGAPGRARVAMAHEGGRPTAFLAVRAGLFTALPIGAPMSDYQAVVAEPGRSPDLPALLGALGVSRWDFTHVPASQIALAAGFQGRTESRMVDLSGGWPAVVAGLKARGSDLVRDVGKRLRRMEREAGPVELVWDDPDEAAFSTFVGWKRSQYRETRQTDVLAPAWVERLTRDLRGRRDPAFRGLFTTLRVGGRMVAGHFGLQSAGVTHAWFIAHDCDFGRFSPGMVLMTELARRLAEDGGRELDLGPGEYAFKLRLCDAARPLGYGFVGRPSAATAFRGAAYGVRRWAEARPLGAASALPGKAMRRWDVIRALG
jgi:CelD/BcsL family acetyltransferase involved in cellulose biosynthesis